MHAYVDDAAPGSLTVVCSHHDGELVVSVGDEGRGMTPRPDNPGPGLVLSIIARLSQRLEIPDNAATGTEVGMTFAVRAANVTAPAQAADVGHGGRELVVTSIH
jgi:serine/threonine-protein kinase RsbW